jgi:hypothetical protein
MLCNLSEVKIIRSQMRYNRNLEIRKKVILFLLASRYQDISLACQKLGYQRSFFYFWFNRLKEANFDIKSLEEHSRRAGSASGEKRSVVPPLAGLRLGLAMIPIALFCEIE